ncbi:MAG: hypothetical protein FWH29_09670 [Methanobrevibacter sp.]|nr:hypothetical protein [Methanobrevibacter sp.]
MLERLVLKGTRAVLRRIQEGNLLTLSDNNNFYNNKNKNNKNNFYNNNLL